MEISQKGIEYLTAREGGMRLDVHDDGFGYPTVGVGHKVLPEDNLFIGDTITLEQGQELLKNDLIRFENKLTEDLQYTTRWPLKQHQFDALVCWMFNVGTTAWANSTLKRLLVKTTDDMNGIVSRELPKWSYVNKEFVRGLLIRRLNTVMVFVDGDYTVHWELDD